MDSSGKKVVVAIVAFGAALATIAYFGKPVVRLKTQTPRSSPSLIVLPFDNLDGADELELIASNTTVAITDALIELGSFDVVPRSTALGYVGIPGGARAIAEELGVDYVLAGSVEHDELKQGRLRLQAYFVKPGDQPRIWADEFFYDAEDAERIPADLARRVREALAYERAR
jgi:TolB-like protein